MKFQVIFLLSCLVLLTQYGTFVQAQSHNVTWGTRNLRDTHLARKVVFQKSSFLRKMSEDFVFEQKNVLYPKIITQVSVIDQYTNGKGGYATLTSGGPNTFAVKLRITSQRSHGFNFIIDIYGQ